MKNGSIIFFLTLFSVCCIAQNSESKIYLFDTFQDGIVYKSENKSSAKLNYNLILEKLVASDTNGNVSELFNPSEITLVQIGDRSFENVKKGLLYEKIELDGGTLYIRWKTKALSKGRDSGYGTSQTAATTNMSALIAKGSSYELNIKNDFNLIPSNSYFLKIDGKFKQFSSFSALAKLLKKDQNKMKEYEKEENLDFKNLEDIKKAVAYCFQL